MTPKNKKPHIGIEIEFFSPCDTTFIQSTFQKKFEEKGAGRFHLGSDGSIDPPPGNVSHEVRLLIEESNLNFAMEWLGIVMKLIEAKVNRTCGLHIHIDCRYRRPSYVFKKLVNVLPVLSSTQPKYRRNNSYCVPNGDLNSMVEHLNEGFGRRAINPHAYNEHKTIEVRLHKGSVNSQEIGNWIKLLLSVIDKPVSKSIINDYKSFVKYIKPEKEQATYVYQKIKKYSPKEVA